MLNLFELVHQQLSRGAVLVQWRGLEMALEQGLTRAIGVSNYNVSHLQVRPPARITNRLLAMCESLV